ncbi:hypothetical protein ATANTOWER_024881 [Ataeniobius toweri]|uniref:UDP-glucuronate decarboxylase N-terminal domain-containing protein n=1 Tax=Ataeniobius toweri TaxID=208326 RepID=A0ABU7C5M4_9TELE|nr:hypothetical protein [Ataeniobius toweri]
MSGCCVYSPKSKSQNSSGLNRRMMKLLFALALIAYIASVWGTYTNMRSIQENGDLKIEQKIDEVKNHQGFLLTPDCDEDPADWMTQI